MRQRTLAMMIGLAAALPALAQTVSLRLESPQNGHTVAPGATIHWTISVEVSTGDNAGLALVSADLVQALENPEPFDLAPAADVPSAMVNFARPAGIGNPAEGGASSGYMGVLRGVSGAQNVVQIGGAQNGAGFALPAGSGIAESASVVAGVGQSGALVIAAGAFTVPNERGTYTISLANPLANVFSVVNPAPAASPASPASVDVVAPSITFTIGRGPGLPKAPRPAPSAERTAGGQP